MDAVVTMDLRTIDKYTPARIVAQAKDVVVTRSTGDA